MNRKDIVARRFGAAAGDYASRAETQRAVAGWMSARLPRVQVAHGLEIGCGTGFLTRHLLEHYPDADWIISDIAPEMVVACAASHDGRARFIVHDGEAAPPEGTFDLIASSLTFQWFEDLPGSVARLTAALAPRGSLVFTTLGAGTFWEWRALLEEYGLASGMPDYPDEDELREMLAASGYAFAIDRLALQETHAGARAFLRHLRDIGADAARPGHRPETSAAWRRVLRENTRSFSVTYDVFCVILIRL